MMVYAVLAVGFGVMHHNSTAKLDGVVYFLGFWCCAVAAVWTV